MIFKDTLLPHLTMLSLNGMCPLNILGNRLMKKDVIINSVKFQLQQILKKSKSWVKKGQEADWLLNHEQGHFDIAQIFVKEFNERVQSELMGKEFSCPSGTNNSNMINNQAMNRVQNIFGQEHQKALQMESHYDTETNYGNNNSKQIEWDKKIQSLLGVERQGGQIDDLNQEVDFLKQIIQDIKRFFISIFDYKITI